MKKLLYLFLTLFLIAFFIIPANAEIYIDHVNYTSWTDCINSESIVRLNNGSIYGILTEQYRLKLIWSYDSGITWFNNTLLSAHRYYNAVAKANSYDEIAVFYSQGDLSPSPNSGECYFAWIDFNTMNLTSPVALSSTLYLRDIDMCIDGNDDIHVVWRKFVNSAGSNNNVIYYRKYTNILESWGATIKVVDSEIWLRGTDNFDFSNIRIIPTYYTNEWIIYVVFTDINGDGSGTSYITWNPFYNQNNECIATLWSNTQYGISTQSSMDMAIDKNNYEILITASLSNYSIGYKIFSFRYVLEIYNGIVYTNTDSYHQNYPRISMTNTNIADIIWSGGTIESPNAKMRYRQFDMQNRVFLIESAYLTTGSDTHIYTTVLYSPYPLTQIPANNFFLCYLNSTKKDFVYYNDIVPIWLSGGGTNGSEYDEQTIYLRLHDITTGNIIHWKGKNINSETMGILDYSNCYLISDYFTLGYGNNEYYFTDKFPLTFGFIDGSTTTFKFSNSLYTNTNFICRINGINKYFKYMTTSLKIYAGQTYDVYLQPTTYIDGVEYNYCGGNDKTNGYVSVCLNKGIYDYGETARIQYTLPNAGWLLANGWKTHGWYISFFNTEFYLWGTRLNDWDFVHRIELSPEQFDGNRHTAEFEITYYNWHGYKQYFQEYEICILNYDAGWLDKSKMFDGLYYYCSGSTFIPNGTIESISPNPAYFGQEVTISFLSNGVGRLEINYPSGDRYFTQEYLYSDSLHSITKAITGVGNFSIELYTYGKLAQNTSIPVDTDTLKINPLGENGSFGNFGFGVPYLYIPLYRVIAGYDTLQIYYRSYKNNSRLNITSPRGEMTYFSTTVSNESDNVLNIQIPNYMMIGTWNVTLIGGDIYGNNETLYSSFNVVNEEGNWIEFSKHIYTTLESFSVFIKHTYRVSLTFYKDDIAQGESILLNVGEHDNELFNIPLEIISPTIGNWRVEMWRINDRNVVYELAEWNCIVIYAQTETIPSDVTIDIIGFLNLAIPDDLQFILGIVIIILCFVIVALLGKKLDIQNMPMAVYLIAGICGFITDIKLQLFDFWITVIFTFVFSVLAVWYILGQFGILSQPMGQSVTSIKERIIRPKQTKNEKPEKAKKNNED